MTLRRILIIFLLIGAYSPAKSQGSSVGTRIDLRKTLALNEERGSQFAQLFIPDYYQVPPDGGIVLVIHFHSASRAAEDEVYRSRANAILFSIHLGAFSTPYRVFFSEPLGFQAILDTVIAVLDSRNIVPSASVRTLILTSFSAGYAGVREILRASSSYSRVDALLLADGLHADSDSSAMVAQMAGFARFAVDARDRKKVFLLTHSDIQTTGYRSTTQTADYLLDVLGVRRRPVEASDEIGLQTSACDTGYFHLRGYAGMTAPDHMKHLYSMHRMVSETLTILHRETSDRGDAGETNPGKHRSRDFEGGESTHPKETHATGR
jgi:hypothetical protein